MRTYPKIFFLIVGVFLAVLGSLPTTVEAISSEATSTVAMLSFGAEDTLEVTNGSGFQYTAFFFGVGNGYEGTLYYPESDPSITDATFQMYAREYEPTSNNVGIQVFMFGCDNADPTIDGGDLDNCTNETSFGYWPLNSGVAESGYSNITGNQSTGGTPNDATFTADQYIFFGIFINANTGDEYGIKGTSLDSLGDFYAISPSHTGERAVTQTGEVEIPYFIWRYSSTDGDVVEVEPFAGFVGTSAFTDFTPAIASTTAPVYATSSSFAFGVEGFDEVDRDERSVEIEFYRIADVNGSSLIGSGVERNVLYWNDVPQSFDLATTTAVVDSGVYAITFTLYSGEARRGVDYVMSASGRFYTDDVSQAVYDAYNGNNYSGDGDFQPDFFVGDLTATSSISELQGHLGLIESLFMSKFPVNWAYAIFSESQDQVSQIIAGVKEESNFPDAEYDFASSSISMISTYLPEHDDSISFTIPIASAFESVASLSAWTVVRQLFVVGMWIQLAMFALYCMRNAIFDTKIHNAVK